MHTPRAYALLPCLLLVACGPGPHPAAPAATGPAPRATTAVQVWPGCPELQQAKAVILQAARAAHASPERAALLLAVAMGETQTCQARDRDATKDAAGDAANLSALNMNKAYLKHLGWQDGQGPDLNEQAHLGDAVGWALRGMEALGEDGFLNYHRGGETGHRDGTSYGCAEYRQAIRQVQDRLLAEPALQEGPQRVGCEIPHV